MPFLLSCMVVVDAFGHFVRQDKHLDVLAKIPTFIVQTELDDSADHVVGMQIVKELEDRSGMYPTSAKFLENHLTTLLLMCSDTNSNILYLCL